jgi:hypothetical protein
VMSRARGLAGQVGSDEAEIAATRLEAEFSGRSRA